MASVMEAAKFASLSDNAQSAIVRVMTPAQRSAMAQALRQLQSGSGLSGFDDEFENADGLGFLSSIAKALTKVVGGITGFLAPAQTPTIIQAPAPAPAPAQRSFLSTPGGIAMLVGGGVLLLVLLRK